MSRDHDLEDVGVKVDPTGVTGTDGGTGQRVRDGFSGEDSHKTCDVWRIEFPHVVCLIRRGCGGAASRFNLRIYGCVFARFCASMNSKGFSAHGMSPLWAVVC